MSYHCDSQSKSDEQNFWMAIKLGPEDISTIDEIMYDDSGDYAL